MKRNISMLLIAGLLVSLTACAATPDTGQTADGEEVELTSVRDTIEVQTVEYEMMEGQIGYISVSEFDEVTYEQFSTALNDLESQDMKGLVIDVRNNPGGNVETVTDMLKLLLPEGPIMSTKDKEGNT